MRNAILLLTAVFGLLVLVGCSGTGDVDTNAVQTQAEKEKKINDEQAKNLPPGEGPSG